MLSSSPLSRGNEVVLSYHDCILRRSDVELLRGPCWLNDALIGFYLEYLSHRHPGVLFVAPELTQLLKLTEINEYPVFLEPLGALDRELLLFPLNDCNSRSTAGGSHWSLLVFSRPERTCFHFDSSHGMNAAVAREFSRSISSYLLQGIKAQYAEFDCPQQDNGHDCGLFVLCYADIVAEYFRRTGKVEGCDCSFARTQVAGKRSSLLTLIDELKH